MLVRKIRDISTYYLHVRVLYLYYLNFVFIYYFFIYLYVYVILLEQVMILLQTLNCLYTVISDTYVYSGVFTLGPRGPWPGVAQTAPRAQLWTYFIIVTRTEAKNKNFYKTNIFFILQLKMVLYISIINSAFD